MPGSIIFRSSHVEVHDYDHGEYESLHITVHIGIDSHTFELPCNMPHSDAEELGRELDRVLSTHPT